MDASDFMDSPPVPVEGAREWFARYLDEGGFDTSELARELSELAAEDFRCTTESHLLTEDQLRDVAALADRIGARAVPPSTPSNRLTTRSRTRSPEMASPEASEAEILAAKRRAWARAVLVPAGVAGLYAIVDLIDDGPSLLGALDPGVRQALFISASAATAALLGFAITGVTVLLTVGQGPRMAWLHKQPMFTRNVRFVFFSAIVALAAATFVYLGLIAVGSNAGFGCAYGLIAAVATAATVDRLWRLIGFLHRLMGVALSDKENPSPRNPEFTESMDD